MMYSQHQLINLFGILFSIFNAVFSNGQFISSIEIYPQSTTIQARNSHILTCNVTGDTASDIFWYFNGQKIPTENSIDYNITSFSAGTEGRYHCVAENSYGKIVSSSINLKLAHFTVDRLLLPSSTPIISPNTSFLLQCPLYAVDSLPPPSVTWLLNSVQIQLSYPLVLTLDGGLVFSLVRSTDAGIYSCRVTNSLLNVYEDFQVAAISQLKQQTTRDAEFHATPIDRAASLGDDVSFQCIIGSSSSTPPVIWKFGDVSLTASERILFSQSSGILTIRAVRLRDAGSYSCSDASGRLDPKPFTLTVITPPEITENQSPLLEPLHSSNVSLSCESQGTAPLNYSWFYNGAPIDRSRAFFSGEGTQLDKIEIHSLLPSDDGVYQCFVRNSAGEDSRAFILSVQFQLPILITPHNDILAFVGGNFVFGCLAVAAPTPVYTYTLDNLPLPSAGYTKLNGTHYAILGASKSQSGVYSCNISNSIGSVSQMFIIRIIDPTTPYSSMPRNITSFHGDTVTLACRGIPDPSFPSLTLQYRWKHNGSPISTVGRFKLTSNHGDLLISSVNSSDSGNYSCFAKTSDTSLTSTLYLETLIGSTILLLPDTPSPPTGVAASLNGSAVHLSWSLSVSDSDNIVSYLVEYRVGSQQWSEAGGSSSNSFSFSTCPDLTYVFRVYAINSVGRSGASPESAQITSPQQVPSIVPVNVSVQSTEIPFNLDISWEIPIPPNTVCTGLNGELINHWIEYRLSPQSPPTYISTGSRNTYLLTGLTPFTSYQIRVAFGNYFGNGSYSVVGIGTTSEDRPAFPPSNFEIESYGEGRIAVYFTAPNELSRNGLISGYKVTCQESSGEEITTLLPANNDSTLNILPNFLKTLTQYYCNVLAYNSKGDGPATVNEMVFPSVRMVPSIPKSLMIALNGSYQASFAYTPPDDIDEMILTLRYTYPLTPHVTREQCFRISASTNEHTLYNLDAGVVYAVKLSGRNEDGIGFNRTEEMILPPGRPRAPSILQNKSSNAGIVTIIWYIIHDGGSNITKTVLEQRFQSDTDTTWIPIKTFSSFNTSYEMPIPENPLQVRIVIQNIYGSATSTSVELNATPRSEEFSSTIIIVLVVVVLIVLGILVLVIICAISYFSCRREHKKDFLDFRRNVKLSADEESSIFRNLNEQTADKKRTSFPLPSESSSDGTGTGTDNNPPSYHSNFPSKDSKISIGSKSSRSSGSSRHKVEIAERKQEPISKGVLAQPGKVQSTKLAHKTVVFVDHQTQSSIDSDSTEPSQASWTNTFNRQVRDSPIPILEEPSPPLPPRRHGDQQPHPLSFTTHPYHNVNAMTSSDVWDPMHQDSLTNLQNPVHLISHKKSRSDELSDHYSIRYDDPLDVLPPAVAKLRGKQARKEQPTRSKSPMSYLAQKLSFSPTKAKDRSIPTPVPDETPDPNLNTSSPTFDETALSDTIFSDSLRKPRVSYPVFHQHTDSNLSQPTSSQPSFC